MVNIQAPTIKPPGFTKEMYGEMKEYFTSNYIEQIPVLKTRCQIDGVLESVCVPLSSVTTDLDFCAPDLYEFICIPVYNWIWPDWNLKEKDFTIQM